MWILESRGDFFQGRRMWLKPGKQYLFGRVKKDGVRFALDHKTVSRKHFVISVDDVKEADVGNVHARTAITITDQGSKTGTLVNGERTKESRTLNRVENVIRLGTCQEELIVKWEPIVLTFNLLKKDFKAGILRSKQERIRELDIKAISDYIPGISTLLVASKRNTAKGLQALIDGKHIVTESYIDALEYAATPTDLEEEENLSLLELDFDKAWPNPVEHLPPRGKELTLRSEACYMPDDSRQTMFSNYTFVFADQTQFDNLLPPITTGHGKALLYPLRQGETTSEEVALYMHQAAGRKSFGDERKDADGGAVILVQWNDKRNPEWTMALVNEVSLSLDQRAIEQGDFLDAILASDASILRQSVPYESIPASQGLVPSDSEPTVSRQLSNRYRLESTEASVPPRDEQPPAKVNPASSSPQTSEPNQTLKPSVSENEAMSTTNKVDQSPPRVSYRFSPRIKAQSSAFDDDFDEDAVIPFEDDEDEALDSVDIQPSNGHRQGDASDSVSEDGSVTNGLSSRKRPRSAVSLNAELSADHDLDDFVPTSTALKRRKLAHDEQVKKESPQKLTPRGIVSRAPKAKDLKDIDVKQELRAQREKAKQLQEAQAQADEDGPPRIEYDGQGNVIVYEVQTEYMDLPVRKIPVSNSVQTEGRHWDPKWNGRKNFKAFRRARDNDLDSAGNRRRTRTKLIVPLVEAKQATYGIGDEYWEPPDADRERDKARKQRASQISASNEGNSSNQITSGPSEVYGASEQLLDDRESTPEGITSSSPVSPAVARLQQEAIDILDDDIDVDQPRRTRADDTRSQAETESPAKSLRGMKRPGSSG